MKITLASLALAALVVLPASASPFPFEHKGENGAAAKRDTVSTAPADHTITVDTTLTAFTTLTAVTTIPRSLSSNTSSWTLITAPETTCTHTHMHTHTTPSSSLSASSTASTLPLSQTTAPGFVTSASTYTPSFGSGTSTSTLATLSTLPSWPNTTRTTTSETTYSSSSSFSSLSASDVTVTLTEVTTRTVLPTAWHTRSASYTVGTGSGTVSRSTRPSSDHWRNSTFSTEHIVTRTHWSTSLTTLAPSSSSSVPLFFSGKPATSLPFPSYVPSPKPAQ